MLKSIVNGVEHDIVSIPMKGKNLFDMTTLEGGIYLAASGAKYGDVTSGVRSGTKIKVLPNTAYTLSAQSSEKVSLRILEWSNVTFIKQTPKYNISGSVFLTVTTDANTTEIAFNIEGTNGQYTTNIMLNVGSTALPYEPYGYQNGWEIRDNQDRLIWGREDTITEIPPFDLRTYGLPINTWELYGNSYQSTTPTPDNPVIPEFVGVRTLNLFDINATPIKYSQSTVVIVNGQTLTITGSWYIYYEIDVVPNTDYYINWTIDYAEIEGRGTIAILTTSGQAIHSQSVNPYSFNSGENQRVRLLLYSGSSTSATVILSNIMLNTGTAALPYEPYGWAEKITCGGQTVHVYLGQVSTVRRVRKLVLTGEENIVFASEDANRLVGFFTIPGMGMKSSETGYCNILLWKKSYSNSEYNRIVANTGQSFYMSLEKSILPEQTINGFITYLRQQYQNGTPVTIWYVMQEPVTRIINEPLAKIGNYADELNSTNAEIGIQTTDGINTLDVNTDLKPSYLSLTGHIKMIRYILKDVDGYILKDVDGYILNVKE